MARINVTSVTQSLVSGTAPAGATVTVIVDGSSVGTTTANGSGAWSKVVSLANGDHAVKATIPTQSPTISFDIAAAGGGMPLLVSSDHPLLIGGDRPLLAA